MDVAAALLVRLRAGWRRLVVPPTVRDAQAAGPARAAGVLPPEATAAPALEGLGEAEARLARLRAEQRRIEARLRGLARLGGRAGERRRAQEGREEAG